MFRVLQIYKSIVHGVAFVPLIILVVLTLLALSLTLSPVISEFSRIVYSGGYFEVRTPETARAVLTAIVTGMISLTVFGFTMMMVVVNQAASNYSPKVVETLISQRSNQYTLGVNLGTIVFALIVMIHVDNRKADGGIPELAIFVASVLTVYCLLLFVRFINNISNSVRINNIIDLIYKRTKQSVKHRQKGNAVPCDATDTGSWSVYTAEHAGYFQMVRVQRVIAILKTEDAVMKVLPLPGSYYLRHEPLFAASKPLSDKTVDLIRSGFVTYHGEPIGENPMYGFRQLREIAVKALSPGINDPGVAILCVEHLAELLCMELHTQKECRVNDEDHTARIIQPYFDFTALLGLSFVPIQVYGRRDFTVLSALLHAAYQIALADKARQVRGPLSDFVLPLLKDTRESITNTHETKLMRQRIDELSLLRYFDASIFVDIQGR